MDESSLLDLLECSVCLERLDTTAKVLPCQHTFCRRCLENIVSSRNELRCPECRILVGCEVDDLPANILLVRLLDGIKQRPRNAGSTRQSQVGGGESLGCAAGISASPQGSGIRDLPVATRSSPVKVLGSATWYLGWLAANLLYRMFLGYNSAEPSCCKQPTVGEQ
uniref:RING-type domain-containing protein n=1 Tax=Hucho hucho TaxID=62062 RepID=A0A4W5JTE7_9TELE